MPDLLENETAAWLGEQLAGITDDRTIKTVSEWAESTRYLQATSQPGYYDFDLMPYLREIADRLSVTDPNWYIAVRKGVQLGLTVGVLENAIGYCIEHVKSAPVMLLTADSELAKIRMESYITPMLQHSDMLHLIKSNDETNKRKTGKTDKKLEWEGGGFLIPFGAKNADKLRSLSIQYLLRDEVDAYPGRVGKDGDPIVISRDRTAAYEANRKICDLSTPLIKGSSNIDRGFRDGDQRRYMVPCLNCGKLQHLEWSGTRDDGERYGITWEMDGDRLKQNSVRYLCKHCLHPHRNADKTKMFDPENGAHWKPTAQPAAPGMISYDLPSLYSPVGFQSWETLVYKWLEAWDVVNNQVRDVQALQVFYNNVLARSFERTGDRLRPRTVSRHRRGEYHQGQVPNLYADQVAGGPMALVTSAADIHKDRINLATFGWSPGRRAWLLDYWIFEGNPLDLEDPETWGKVRDVLENHVYRADDGKAYRVAMTMIDAGYEQDLVATFCQEYESGVYPIIGRDRPTKAQRFDEFTTWVTKLGTRGFRAVVDVYKDRWSLALRKKWDGVNEQPAGHFNAPIDLPDDRLWELTVEQRKVKEDSSGREVGYYWHRPQGARNELWDLLVYNSLALDVVAWDLMCNQREADLVDFNEFWALCYEQSLYYEQERSQ